MVIDAVVILSGGMDSTTLLYDLKNRGLNLIAISFEYKQKHIKEIECAKMTCKKLNVEHKILNLDVLSDVAPSSLTRNEIDIPDGHYAEDSMKQTVVPNRNMVMISLAASFAMSKKINKLYYGAHAGDHIIYPDCRKEFIDKIKEILLISDWHKVEFEAPYFNINKADIVEIGKNLNVDYSLTWTCYNGRLKACGKCGSCNERLESFKIVGMVDPIEYEYN